MVRPPGHAERTWTAPWGTPSGRLVLGGRPSWKPVHGPQCSPWSSCYCFLGRGGKSQGTDLAVEPLKLYFVPGTTIEFVGNRLARQALEMRLCFSFFVKAIPWSQGTHLSYPQWLFPFQRQMFLGPFLTRFTCCFRVAQWPWWMDGWVSAWPRAATVTIGLDKCRPHVARTSDFSIQARHLNFLVKFPEFCMLKM